MLKGMKKFNEINFENVENIMKKLEDEYVTLNYRLLSVKNHGYIIPDAIKARLCYYSENIRMLENILGYELFGCLLSDIYDDEDEMYRGDEDFIKRKELYDNIIEIVQTKSFDFEHYRELY